MFKAIAAAMRQAAWFAAFSVCLWHVAAAAEHDVANAGDTAPALVQQAATLLDGETVDSAPVVQAGALLGKALKLDPRYAPAYREYARYLMFAGFIRSGTYRDGTLEAANAAIDKAIALDPSFAEAYVLRGFVMTRQGRLDEAGTALAKGEALGSTSAWLHDNWGDLLMRQGKVEAAAERYRSVVRERGHAPRNAVISAYQGLIAYAAARHDREAQEASYRAIVEQFPEHAWGHGNYAQFLLCVRDDYRGAIGEASTARALADYGIARITEAAARYRQWAQQVLEARQAPARASYAAAFELFPASPDRALEEACNNAAGTEQVLLAMQRTGAGQVLPATAAVLMAADSTPMTVPGIFMLRVQATARIGGDAYLNSERDYRDPRCLSVRIRPDAIRALESRWKQPLEQALKDRVVLVRGRAGQVRIDFTDRGTPTGKFYYQTHVVVDRADQLETLEEWNARLPEERQQEIEGGTQV